MELSKYRSFFIGSVYSMHFSNLRISERLCPKLLKFLMQASLAEAFMWAKFQIQIQKYSFAAKVECYRKKSLKSRYLVRNKPETRTFFTLGTAHYGLQDARNPG
jgi:hypothetical protein